jgi:hypothetical protein
MHVLVISLLTILTGTLLLAKFKKENPGKFFTWISWFFIVVGLGLFLHFAGFGIWRMTHQNCSGQPKFHHGMMMKKWHHEMEGIGCCREGMDKGMCSEKPGCMPHDSMMKCCPKHMEGDSVKMPGPK